MNARKRHGEGEFLERALDGSLGDDEWRRFEEEAAAEEWRDLARGLVEGLALRAAVERLAGPLEQVELPLPEARALPAGPRRSPWSHPVLGWIAALLLFLVLSLEPDPAPGPAIGPERVAVLADAAPASPDAAFEQYVRLGREEGRFVQELPRLVLEAGPAARGDGSVEVLYLRRLVERAVMDELYELAFDDAGSPSPRAVPAARLLDRGSH